MTATDWTTEAMGTGEYAEVNGINLLRDSRCRTAHGSAARRTNNLGLDKPDLVVHSLGGGVALRTAIYLPGKVGCLVAASAHIRSDAIYAEMLAQRGQVNAAAAEFMKDTRGTTSTSESRRDRRTSLDYSTSSVS